MGGDDSQKLLPWRGIYFPSGAQTSGSNYEINNVTETAVGISWVPPPLASLALASATARLGHFWKAQVGQFCRAPKTLRHTHYPRSGDTAGCKRTDRFKIIFRVVFARIYRGAGVSDVPSNAGLTGRV
jgi:hypothetical protein